MDPTALVISAALPPDLLANLFQPAALFAVWSGLVVSVIAGLSAVLATEGSEDRSRSRACRIVAAFSKDADRPAAA